MARVSVTRLAMLLVVAVAISAWFTQGRLAHRVADATGRLLAPVAARIGYRRTHESAKDAERISSMAARADALAQENAMLRAAVGLKERNGLDGVVAGAFAYVYDGSVRQIVVNRGIADGVVDGDIVITGAGTLVGVVENVYAKHAVVARVGDPNVRVVGRVIGTEVSGLVLTDVSRGLVLDFVRKDEVVMEGQVVVTGGNDQFPSGIIIGTVASVADVSATLFKVIRIAVAVPGDFSGGVIIIHPR